MKLCFHSVVFVGITLKTQTLREYHTVSIGFDLTGQSVREQISLLHDESAIEQIQSLQWRGRTTFRATTMLASGQSKTPKTCSRS